MKFTGERFIPGISGQIEIEHLNRYYFVINQIDLSDLVVLDLASGEGYGSDLLAKFSKKVIGIDISTEIIEHAKSKYIRSNLTFLVGDAVNIPLPDHSIDVFVSFETIEHHASHPEMMDEIKRVLKPKGILFISSPDKYYYSDLPQYKNEFHIKELYYEDFKSLIYRYFKNSIFFSQKIFVGSIITLDEDEFLYKKPLIVERNGTSYQFIPTYNIAIGTDSPDFFLKYQQILLKESDYFITKADLDKAVISVRNTRSFRIANIFLAPFRYLFKLLSL
jgi:ubiquinone/menaquinone biosynthesis C-methylase UbiE